ncbi:hypothetical protein CBR_g41140 [Chara braunii]|uniref:RAP domain-containing protein n=1 Tax=Chara braunii TaxID=69332 RepID=A0A388LV81_CHABU|nr:hypothetical protein CBR_g41140 [Chara braunii]|eukprot:GBG86236.1 hypothetical protein CBR_g41140 [Chara braunii]
MGVRGCDKLLSSSGASGRVRAGVHVAASTSPSAGFLPPAVAGIDGSPAKRLFSARPETDCHVRALLRPRLPSPSCAANASRLTLLPCVWLCRTCRTLQDAATVATATAAAATPARESYGFVGAAPRSQRIRSSFPLSSSPPHSAGSPGLRQPSISSRCYLRDARAPPHLPPRHRQLRAKPTPTCSAEDVRKRWDRPRNGSAQRRNPDPSAQRRITDRNPRRRQLAGRGRQTHTDSTFLPMSLSTHTEEASLINVNDQSDRRRLGNDGRSDVAVIGVGVREVGDDLSMEENPAGEVDGPGTLPTVGNADGEGGHVPDIGLSELGAEMAGPVSGEDGSKRERSKSTTSSTGRHLEKDQEKEERTGKPPAGEEERRRREGGGHRKREGTREGRDGGGHRQTEEVESTSNESSPPQRSYREKRQVITPIVKEKVMKIVKASWSVPHLLRLIREEKDQMSPFEISTAFHRVGKAARSWKSNDKAVLRRNPAVVWLANRVETHMGEYGSQALANIAWAHSVLGHGGPLLMDRLTIEAIRKASGFLPLEILSMVIAFARLNYVDEDVLSVFQELIYANLSKFRIWQLSEIAWAFAKLKFVDRELFEVIGNHSGTVMANMCARDVSNLIWGFAKLGLKHEAMMQAIAKHSVKIMNKFDPQSVSNVVWSYASFDWYDAELMEAIAARATRTVDRLSPQALGNTAWGFAVLNHYSPALLDAIAKAAASKIATVPSQNMSNILFTLASFGHPSSTFLDVYIDEVNSRLEEGKLPRQAAANIAWALVVLGHFPRRLFPLLRACLSQYDDYSSRELCQLYQVELALKVEAPEMGERQRGLDSSPRQYLQNLWLSGYIKQFAKGCWEDMNKKENLLTSNFQRSIAEVLDDMGLEPVTEYEVGGYKTDMALPSNRVIIEADGPTHFAANMRNWQMGPTRLKARVLQAQGWSVVQIAYFAWEEMSTHGERRALLENCLLPLLPPSPIEPGQSRTAATGVGGSYCSITPGVWVTLSPIHRQLHEKIYKAAVENSNRDDRQGEITGDGGAAAVAHDTPLANQGDEAIKGNTLRTSKSSNFNESENPNARDDVQPKERETNLKEKGDLERRVGVLGAAGINLGAPGGRLKMLRDTAVRRGLEGNNAATKG